MSWSRRIALPFAVLVALAACARLPEYAQPRMTPGGPDQPQYRGISYRALTRDDFRAPAAPEHLSAHAGHVNAHSAIRIRPAPGSRLVITQGDLFGQPYYFGRIEHLSFEAVLVQELSWWNPAVPPGAVAYVLQHEQIHFALTEIAARRLTRDVEARTAALMIVKPDPQAVRDELLRLLADWTSEAMAAGLERHTRFDEDTSMFYSPRRQAWWWQEVTDELRQTNRADPAEPA